MILLDKATPDKEEKTKEAAKEESSDESEDESESDDDEDDDSESDSESDEEQTEQTKRERAIARIAKVKFSFNFLRRPQKFEKNLPLVLTLLSKNSCLVKTSGRFFPILWHYLLIMS